MIRELKFDSLQEMIHELDASGIDVKRFDELGNKTLAQLFEECRQREVILMHDEEQSRVIRVAFTAAVLIRIVENLFSNEENIVVKEKLLEVERIYPERFLPDGTFVPERRVKKEKQWSMSETRRKDFQFDEKTRTQLEARGARDLVEMDRNKTVEPIVQTAIRGLAEEFQLIVQESSLKYSFPETYGHEFPIYRSTAYHEMHSHTHVQRFTLDYLSRPLPLSQGRTHVRDNGTKIVSQWKKTEPA